jgi:signal transduction histidine kinase
LKNAFRNSAFKDDGVGIMPDDIQKLFKVDSNILLPAHREKEGTGLGLSLVADIISKTRRQYLG